MILKCVFVASYLLVSCWSKLSIPNDEDLEEYSMAECVYNISSVYFDRDLPIFVQAPRKITNHRYFNYMEKIIQKLQIQNELSIILLGGTKFRPIKNSENIMPGSYIIVLPTSLNAADLNYMTDTFLQIAFFAYNPKGRAVIVNPEEKSLIVQHKTLPHFSLSIAWGYEFLQAIFLNPKPDVGLNPNRTNTNFDVYSWSINDQIDLCSGEINKIRHFDTWLSQERRFSRHSKLFGVNEDVDLKGCKLNLFMQSMPPYSWITRDGNYDGAVAKFLDFASGLINVSLKISQDIENMHIGFPSYYTDEPIIKIWPKTYPHILKKITWFVPSGSEIPRWQSLWRTFSPLLWFLILLTFTFGTFTIWLLHKSTGESIFSVFLFSLLTHLGIGVRDRYKGFVATLFFIIWLFYCLIINTAYQSELFRLLVNPGHFPAIQTLKELGESHLIMERVLVFTGNESYLGNFIMHYNECDGSSVIECYKKVAIDRSHAILESADIYTIEVISTSVEFSDEFGNPKLVPLKESLGTLYICLQISRMAGLLLDVLDNTLQKFVSAGIFDFWSSSVHDTFRRQFITRNIIDQFVFSLDHLQGSFILFFLGHLLATVIYIIDISTHLIHYYFFLYIIAGCLSRVYLL
ncbi:Ionotropic receptor 300 [Blattella germanica]|nr:Ionotropic receptor 300 [Blattella germanica]